MVQLWFLYSANTMRHNSVNIVNGVTVIVLCTFCLNILNGLKIYGADTISILIITKGHNTWNIERGVTVLVFWTSSNHDLHLFQVSPKYLECFKSYWADTISILIITVRHNSVNIVHGVTVPFSAHHLIMVYICIKFHKNMLNNLRIMEQTQFHY